MSWSQEPQTSRAEGPMHVKYVEAQTSSRWCGVKVRRSGCQLRWHPHPLTTVQNNEIFYTAGLYSSIKNQMRDSKETIASRVHDHDYSINGAVIVIERKHIGAFFL
ncbi:hypothetical protein TNCV_4263391 [Trichonephila clavipes]|nr:hypothetical protein TNCV_4263391 [Trichonephila clavipes]